MRAVVVEPGAPNRLGFQEVEEPSPAPSEALVRVAAISLNRGEVRRVQSSYEAGFRPGWDLGDGAMLVAVTEKKTKKELDAFVEVVSNAG
jgi:NADPH:quinone reductase-like Zn-dependent oxidoreductase